MITGRLEALLREHRALADLRAGLDERNPRRRHHGGERAAGDGGGDQRCHQQLSKGHAAFVPPCQHLPLRGQSPVSVFALSIVRILFLHGPLSRVAVAVKPAPPPISSTVKVTPSIVLTAFGSSTYT